MKVNNNHRNKFQFKQSFLSKFCGLDKSTIPPVYLQLSTTLYRLLSCCSQHFSCPRSRFLYSYASSGGHAQRQRQETNRSGHKLSHIGSFNTKNFFSESQKNLVNSENKENLSNYQLLKREPSVCSTSLLFSKLITVVQFFFRVTPVLQWFQLNFGAGNFRGRRPGTSALRMLLRLTAVKVVSVYRFAKI